ncbi:MAG: O-antigen ligase family protein [Bacteroidia bacterium]|nr:O-antigen ligase family protein [Bacteroidia bacterium]
MSLRFFQDMFVSTQFFLPYLLPLIILYAKFNVFFFKYLLRITYILIFFEVALKLITLTIGFDKDSDRVVGVLMSITSLAGGILLFVSHLYRNKNVLKLLLLNFILGLIIASFLGRRGSVVSHLYYLIFFIILRYKSKLIRKVKKRVYLIWAFLIVIIFFLSYSYLEKNVYVFQRGFTSQGWEESRGDVIRAFFKDFSSTSDWIFGRGLNGMILRSVGTDPGTEAGTVESGGIENGFLWVLLKGGLLYLLPMLFLFLRASYLGFFKTKNDLTKALAATIIIRILTMFSFGIPELSTGYIITWISVSSCYSGRLRSLTNTEIIKILN